MKSSVREATFFQDLSKNTSAAISSAEQPKLLQLCSLHVRILFLRSVYFGLSDWIHKGLTIINTAGSHYSNFMNYLFII